MVSEEAIAVIAVIDASVGRFAVAVIGALMSDVGGAVGAVAAAVVCGH